MSRKWQRSSRLGFGILLVVLNGATAPTDDFLLDRHRAGKIVIGMPETAIYNVYPREITRKVDLQLEGTPTPAIQVFLTKDQTTPSLIIRLDGPQAGVYGIDVRDARFKTREGIGVGSSLGQLRKTRRRLFISDGEGAIFAAVEDLGMSFSLLLDSQSERAYYATRRRYARRDNPSIPDATKIGSVWVYRSPESSTVRQK
jgi:hypothetical protein